jgi:hypothetical protein
MRFPEGSAPYSLVVGYTLDLAEAGNLPAAIAKVEQALTAASLEQCEGWLVMLQAATAHRQDSEITSAVAYSLYASELRQWPADVAKAACERLARGRPGQTGTNWFPDLAELVRECERLAAPRRALLSSLQRQAKRLEQPAGRAEPTEAERDAVRRMAADTLRQLAEAAAVKDAKAKPALPSIAGRVDETGITPELRALVERQRGLA